MKKTIGIVGQKQDGHVQSLLQACRQKGLQAYVFDFTNFPKYNLLTVSSSSGGSSVAGPAISFDDITELAGIPVKDCDLLLVRNLGSSIGLATDTAEAVRHSTQAGCGALALEHSFIRLMQKHIPVINNLTAARFHSAKAWLFFLLHSQGIRVPGTLVTNDPARARAFVKELAGRVIAKPNASGAEVVMADEAFFGRNKEILLHRPFIFQQYVSGRSFRAYTLGGLIISAGEIHFDRSYVDWRERVQRVDPCLVEPAVADQLTKAVRTLGLAYCGVDFEYDQYTNQSYLLDFNPSALFTGWSQLVNLNMAEKIVEYALWVLEHKTYWYDEIVQ
jgi:glutathione synthase/RimK-type ligase-like ATP-grasp enzyme